jgi:hypothetical protein
MGARVQEDSFEFDQEFRDFHIDNTLLRQHKEWDHDAMTGNNGSMMLLPSTYNRYSPLPLSNPFALVVQASLLLHTPGFCSLE